MALLHTCTIILPACTSVPLCVPFLLCTEWQPSALFSSRLQCHPVCACHRWWPPLHLDHDLYHCSTQCMLTYCMCGCAYTAHAVCPTLGGWLLVRLTASPGISCVCEGMRPSCTVCVLCVCCVCVCVCV